MIQNRPLVQKTFINQGIRVFHETGYGEEIPPIVFFQTTCCAMGIMSANNYHSVDEIQESINWIVKDSNSRKYSPAERDGGERNILMICTPNEKILEDNIIKVGFKLLNDNLKRRLGYPAGNLKLYMYSF